MMNENSFHLGAISPLDGRYAARLKELQTLVSEGGLIKFRTIVECAWLLELQAEAGVDWKPSRELIELLKDLSIDVPLDFLNQVKVWEATTNHDVKAIEYALRDCFKRVGASERDIAMIHFACTSEDINNLAYGLMLKEVRDMQIVPSIERILDLLTDFAENLAITPMLSRTHGQTASPTTLGKELAVFAHRLNRQREQLLEVRFEGKMSGAVGNYNAHVAAYPNVNWPALAQRLIENRLGLDHNPLTTQIDNHYSFVEYCDIVRRMSVIGIDLCRDIWGYISLGYFRQSLKDGEVGSSTMPHKVNPIDFENAEGNFGLTTAFAQHFAEKLPISRWQRDLSDSTVLRSFGSFAGHFILAMKSLEKGLTKITADKIKLESDLDSSYEVLGEALQTVMRRRGISDAYERLKAATRGKPVDALSLEALVSHTPALTEHDRHYLRGLKPSTYTGIAGKLALDWVGKWRGINNDN